MLFLTRVRSPAGAAYGCTKRFLNIISYSVWTGGILFAPGAKSIPPVQTESRIQLLRVAHDAVLDLCVVVGDGRKLMHLSMHSITDNHIPLLLTQEQRAHLKPNALVAPSPSG